MKYIKHILFILLALSVGTFAYAATTIPWQTPSTSSGYVSPITVNGTTQGIIVSASSTVGAGGQTTGLTISGGSTTTLNAYFASNIGIATSSPSSPLSVQGNGLLSGTFSAANLTASGTVSVLTSAPVSLGVSTLAAAATAIAVSGRYAYVTEGTTGLQVWNIQNPSSPVAITTYTTLFSAKNIMVSNNYAYISENDGGTNTILEIVDITDPGNPVTIGSINLPNTTPNQMAKFGNTIYFSTTGKSRMAGVDVSDPRIPRLSSNTVLPGGVPFGVFVNSRYLWVPNSANGLFAYDVSNPISPTLVSSTTMAGNGAQNTHNIYQTGSFLFVGQGNGAAQYEVFNVASTTAPAHVTTVSLTNAINALTVSNDTAYIAINNATNGLQLYNCTVMSACALAAQTNTSGIISDFAVSGSYVYAAEVGSKLQVFQSVGVISPTASIGLLQANNALITEDLNVNGKFNATGAQIGVQGITSRGPLSVFAATTTSGTPFSALFQGGVVSVGSSTPYAKLSVHAGAGETNLNVFAISSSTAAFSTSTLLTIDNMGDTYHAGSVGVATTSPWGQLSVTNSASGPAFVIGNSTNTATQFVVNSAGKVGIGTSTPLDLLNVTGNIGISNTVSGSIFVRGGNVASTLSVEFPEVTSVGGFARYFRTTNTSGSVSLQIYKGDGAADLNTNLGGNNNSYLNALVGNVGIATTSPFAKLSVHANNGDTNKILFAVGSSTASATTTLFVIDNTGNVGIATTSPYAALSVVGSSGVVADHYAATSITATSTLAGGATIKGIVTTGYKTPGFTYATTTAWTGTTTLPLSSPAVNDQIDNVFCYTDTGTLNVDVYHTTTHLSLFNASTTQGLVTFTSNNTMTAREKWYADIGTPASSPTKISCTFQKENTSY